MILSQLLAILFVELSLSLNGLLNYIAKIQIQLSIPFGFGTRFPNMDFTHHSLGSLLSLPKLRIHVKCLIKICFQEGC